MPPSAILPSRSYWPTLCNPDGFVSTGMCEVSPVLDAARVLSSIVRFFPTIVKTVPKEKPNCMPVQSSPKSRRHLRLKNWDHALTASQSSHRAGDSCPSGNQTADHP